MPLKHNRFCKTLLLLLRMCKLNFTFSMMLNNSFKYTYFDTYFIKFIVLQFGHYAMDSNHYEMYIIHL